MMRDHEHLSAQHLAIARKQHAFGRGLDVCG